MSEAPSGFNPEQFLQATVSEANTKLPPLPAMNPASPDGLYTGIIGQVKMVAGTIEKGERAGQPWLMAEVPIEIEVPQEVQAALGIKLANGTLRKTDRAFLDLTADGKGLDNGPGKNRRQRQYREALDLNKPGDVWSWQKAVGQPVKVKLKHEMYNGEIQDNVDLVLRR